MSIIPNYTRVYRKRTPLQQEEVAFLLNKPDTSNISRYEKGQREPTNEILLVYHHLFDTPIESFLEPESWIVKERLLHRIKELINALNKEEQITLKNTSKIKFLEKVIIRLTN
ncbi:MAG: helix-turn-helix transcriptional regulator [Saprospiraceae bacterium]|nr:helix-turn-helix transcriptional regulator [Saprospiraceae bacterium]